MLCFEMQETFYNEKLPTCQYINPDIGCITNTSKQSLDEPFGVQQHMSPDPTLISCFGFT